MLKVRLQYKNSELQSTIGAAVPLIDIFNSVKDRFGFPHDASQFLVWTDSPSEVDQRPLGHLQFSSRDKCVVFIEKQDFETMQRFIDRFIPKMVTETAEMTTTPMDIVKDISIYHDQASAFSDPDLQAIVLSMIPFDRIDGLQGDAVVEVITKWFKEEFFTFVKSPKCRLCQSDTQAMGDGPVTAEEVKWRASTASVFHCPSCGAKTRFVRYNSVEKLLETRQGRCGEFANCFGAILAALEFDVRMVIDMSDHVWIEFWSDEKGRYVHVDPCENLIDKPFVYEEGWKKDYLWVIAIGAQQVQDVTKKYSRLVAQKTERRMMKMPDEQYHNLLRYLNQVYLLMGDPDMVELIRQRQECDVQAMDATQRATLPEEQNPRISGQ